MKHDEPLVRRAKRPTGEPHVCGWAATVTTDQHSPQKTSRKWRHTRPARIHRSLSCRAPIGASSKKNQKDWVKWQCSVDPQTQPILCLIIKAMKARGAKEKFGQAPVGGQRAGTPTDARRCIARAGDNRGGQQSLTSWIRLKMPSTVRTSAEDSRGGQRLLTPWMRPNSSPAPAVHAAQAPVVGYISPVPAVTHTASAPVVKYISPAPAVSYAEPAPVVQYISPAPGAYNVCRTSTSCGAILFQNYLPVWQPMFVTWRYCVRINYVIV